MAAPSTQEEMLEKDGGIPSQKRPNQIIFVFAGWLNKLQPLLLYTHFNMDFCMDDGFYVNNIFSSALPAHCQFITNASNVVYYI